MSHGNNTYPTYNYMVNYRQYNKEKYNKEECGSLGIVSDTTIKSPTNLSCGSQRIVDSVSRHPLARRTVVPLLAVLKDSLC